MLIKMSGNKFIFYGLMAAAVIITLSTSSSSSILNSTMAQTKNSTGTMLPFSLGHTPNIIFKRVENSVVQITSKIPLPNTNNPSNLQSQNATTLGSGFVYDKLGHIVTNNHVVGDAKIVDVTFVDRNRYTTKVIGTDIYSDIAVLQIQNTSQGQQQKLLLKPLIIGNSSKLEVGDPVIAIGNPFGLGNTLTTGIVSAIGRVLPAAAEAGGFSIPDVIQTDAPIAPGSSGGPLLDMQGQVVGMNTAGIPSIVGGGIAFAIPSDTITKIVPTLIEKGSYVHPFFGLKGGTLTSDIARNVTGLPAAATNLRGIYVDTITKNGPADRAGIRGSTTDQYSKKHVGDIIIDVDKHPVSRMDDMISYIGKHKSVGDSMTLTVYRNGHILDLKAILTARPSPLPFLPTGSGSPPLVPPTPPSAPPQPHH
jgi:S1-C subfamily serine protease